MRAIWSGFISFGLISIPVKLFSASRGAKMKFHYLRKQDLCPVGYLKICRVDGKKVPNEEIVKGYEYQKGDYVVLEDRDFEVAGVKKNQTIEVQDFVDAEQINPGLIVKPYLLAPQERAEKPYVLLREALKKQNKAAIVLFVLRNRGHLGAILPQDGFLFLNQIRYAREIPDFSEIKAPEQKIAQKELEMALKLIEQLSVPFEHKKYKDDYERELERIVDEKLKGIQSSPKQGESMPLPTGAPDLMEKLKKSLELAREKSRT